MQIKTVVTIDGVNEVRFNNDDHNIAACYYWIKNLGDSTLYVSAKAKPIIGGDDVAELRSMNAVSIETDEGKIYILGAGKVEIHRVNSKICPFLSNRNSGGNPNNGTNEKNYIFSESYMPSNLQENTQMFGFIDNVLYNTSNKWDTCEYQNGDLTLVKSVSGYNLTYSYPIDFTNIKKITIGGITYSNYYALTATAFGYIAPDISKILDENIWVKLNQSVGTTRSEFSTEIDCTGIHGENYIHLAVMHGLESGSNTTYLIIGELRFIYT